jgi:hypothetical protein
MDGRTNLLGRFATPTGDYLAYGLVQFYSSYLPNRDTVDILSAKLELFAVTWFGDSTAPFGFNVYEINRGWGQTTFRWDSLDPGFYNSTSTRGTFSGTVQRDTQWVSVNLDTAMVRRWLKPLTFSNNYGVILIPTPNTNVVRGMHAFEFGADSSYPKLTVIARNVAGTVTDTSVYRVGQDTFLGNIDSLRASSDLIYVQSGVSYRGLLRLDCSSIPRGAIINSADLTLVYNPGASRVNRFTGDSSVVAHAVTSATNAAVFELIGSRANANLSTGLVVFDIRHQVQNWIRDQSKNYGLLLRPTNTTEFSSFDLFAFSNETALDTLKRPKLVVRYTVETN